MSEKRKKRAPVIFVRKKEKKNEEKRKEGKRRERERNRRQEALVSQKVHNEGKAVASKVKHRYLGNTQR